jgi:3-oxoadipate enol-lactonase
VRKPAQLVDIVGGDRVTLGAHDPGDGEDVTAGVRLDVDAHELDRLDLEPRLLAKLAAERVDGVFGLVHETTREIPVTTTRLVAAAREQHAPVALEDALHAGDRVRPVALTARRAREMILGEVELSAAAGAEAPVVEHTHEAHMMENRRVRVVLLHSALGDSRLWKRQVAALEREHHVIAPDLPGWGENPLPTEAFSFVDFVSELLPGVLVGNSFGGMVALRTALAQPKKVERLVLVDAGLPAWDWTEEMRGHFEAGEQAVESGDLDAATEVDMEFWVKPEHRDEVRPQLRRALELQTAHEEPELIWPELGSLSKLTMPTLVVVGSDDHADFHAIAEHLASEIPNADLAIVPGAGHLVGIDQPEELNALLLEFLSETG